MATTKEAVVIILDVGKNTLRSDGQQSRNFFNQAKDCAEKIIQRKIFSDPKDEIGLLLMGTDQTNNNLNSTIGGYEHVSVAFNVSMANWKMQRILEREVKPSKSSEADWLDSLVVGLDFLKNQTVGGKYGSFKIVLITTFSTIVSQSNVESVIKAIRDTRVQVIVITDNVEYRPNLNDNDDDEEAIFSQSIVKSQVQTESERLITEILNKTNGVLCNFDQAFVQLIYFEREKKRPMPWNCKLEFGSNLAINISAYVYIKNTPCLGSWKTQCADGPCQRVKEHFVEDAQLDPEGIGELLRGYMYGSTPVPFDDSLGLSFNAGDKCFKCIGFTDATLIRDEHLTGSGVWIVTAQKDCTASEKKLIALVCAMQESNMAMVVRYVYRSKTKVKVMALFSHQRKSTEAAKYKTVATLKMMEIFFSDNHKYLEFPSLKSKRIEPTQEQYDLIDNLIDSMNLMDANDNENGITEAFPNKKIIDPTIQHVYRTLAHRAMHPTQPIQLPGQDILELVNAPKKIKENATPILEKMKKAFPLENLIKPGKSLVYKKLQEITVDRSAGVEYNDELTAESTGIVAIGTVNPAENFALLLNQGEKFSILCTQMQNVIADLVFKMVVTQNEKLIKALMIYREEAKILGPYCYNEWISEFKNALLERNKWQFWTDVIVENHFGLISTKESEMSTVTEEEAIGFYSGGKGSKVDDDVPADDVDLDDLLGNM